MLVGFVIVSPNEVVGLCLHVAADGFFQIQVCAFEFCTSQVCAGQVCIGSNVVTVDLHTSSLAPLLRHPTEDSACQVFEEIFRKP